VLASELLNLKPDVIINGGINDARAAKNATKTIPIVGTGLGDPVANGLVESLARPGGNLTGFTSITDELAGKRLELLKEIVSRRALMESPVSRFDARIEAISSAGTRAEFAAALHGGHGP